jgi:hypothetical protein
MIRKISAERASLSLTCLWIFFFLISLSTLLWLLFVNYIEESTFRSGIEAISTLYVPYLGAILGFYFAKRAKAKFPTTMRRGAFISAIVVSAIWNFVVIVPILLVLIHRLVWDNAIELASSSGAVLSWLVAPVIGYYFGRSGEKP